MLAGTRIERRNTGGSRQPQLCYEHTPALVGLLHNGKVRKIQSLFFQAAFGAKTQTA